MTVCEYSFIIIIDCFLLCSNDLVLVSLSRYHKRKTWPLLQLLDQGFRGTGTVKSIRLEHLVADASNLQVHGFLPFCLLFCGDGPGDRPGPVAPIHASVSCLISCSLLSLSLSINR